MIDYKEIRRTLHEHPQTAGNEQFAHDTIVKHLQQLHPTKVYTNVGGYGVIAVWETKDSSNQAIRHSSIPTIAFRADTDALPIGHRCGHDGHTTILLRLAELIDEKFSILNSQFLIEDDYTKIVPWCAAHTPQGGVVLLSPAAASYDAFKNFEVRGDFYREQILKLNQNEKN